MAKEEFTVAREEPVCDFCSDPEVFSRYPANDFVGFQVGQWNLTSLGDWAACKACDELIRTKQWDALLDRSVEKFYEQHGREFPEPLLRMGIAELHEKFRHNRRSVQ